MIYSKHHNFVAVRTPKSGSTTMAMYLLDSGLLNQTNDTINMPNLHSSFVSEDGTIRLDGVDPTERLVTYGNPTRFAESSTGSYISIDKSVRDTQMRRTAELNNGLSAFNPVNTLLNSSHITYNRAVEKGTLPEGTPCFSTIRNPVERWLSLVNITYSIQEIEAEGINDMSLRLLQDMTSYRDSVSPNDDRLLNLPTGITSFLYRPQNYYFSENSTLWPLEKIHDHMVSFIESRGGRVRGNWYPRYHGSRDRDIILSTEVVNKINDYYAEDVALWESVI